MQYFIIILNAKYAYKRGSIIFILISILIHNLNIDLRIIYLLRSAFIRFLAEINLELLDCII